MTPRSVTLRQEAARRCPPIDGRFGPSLAARDSALPFPAVSLVPSSFGMSAAEVRSEAARLLAAGWESWEIRDVLAAPAVAA